jgi:PAS domain S-box-containing protein
MRVLSRLSVVQLVSGIGVLLLLVVLSSTLLLIDFQWQQYRAAQSELAGLPASAALLHAVDATAMHRGLSAGLLGGNPAFQDKRESAQAALDQALAKADAATADWNTPRISGLRERVDHDWRNLRAEIAGRSISETQSFERHSLLIQRELELLEEIVDVSTLRLDHNLAFHYLAMAALEYQPRLREWIGRLRGHGVAMLPKPRFAAGDQALLADTLANAHRLFDVTTLQIQRAGATKPSLGRALAPALQRARTTFMEVSGLVRSELLDVAAPHIAGAAYFAAFTRAIDAQAALTDVTLALLNKEMRARESACRRAVAITIGIGLGILLLNSWLVWSIIRAIRFDLALREQARHAAARSSAFLASVLEAAPDSVVIADAAGAIELVNSQVEKTFGFAREELLRKPVHMLFAHPAVVASVGAQVEPVAGAENARVIALECSRKDGSQFPVELGLSPVAIGELRHLIVVARDVSDRRAMEHQLHQSQRMESIGQLTGGLAHDFNNLLGVIVGNLDLLERHVTHDEKASARVRTAQRAALRGSELTKRLLAFARRQLLNPQPTQVNQLVGELLEMLPRTLGPDIKIATKLAADLPSANVDAAGLESALLNLSLNARDAMPSGGKLVIATSLVHLDHEHTPVQAGDIKPGSYIRISVSDSGHGMSPDTIGKVFEPFFTTKPRGKGTGLGLAMVYGFVKQSNGNIRIYSELGTGTTFTLYVPLAEAGAEPTHPDTSPVRPLPKSGGLSGTVLIVDDEIDLLEVAVSYCEELGLRVLHAIDGPSALARADEETHIDLLLTDVVMPGGLNGVDLATRLRARYPKLQVVYCSGFPSSALAERSHLSVDGPLIGKPYVKSMFVQTVVDAIAASTKGNQESAA